LSERRHVLLRHRARELFSFHPSGTRDRRPPSIRLMAENWPMRREGCGACRSISCTAGSTGCFRCRFAPAKRISCLSAVGAPEGDPTGKLDDLSHCYPREMNAAILGLAGAASDRQRRGGGRAAGFEASNRCPSALSRSEKSDHDGASRLRNAVRWTAKRERRHRPSVGFDYEHGNGPLAERRIDDPDESASANGTIASASRRPTIAAETRRGFCAPKPL